MLQRFGRNGRNSIETTTEAGKPKNELGEGIWKEVDPPNIS